MKYPLTRLPALVVSMFLIEGFQDVRFDDASLRRYLQHSICCLEDDTVIVKQAIQPNALRKTVNYAILLGHRHLSSLSNCSSLRLGTCKPGDCGWGALQKRCIIG